MKNLLLSLAILASLLWTQSASSQAFTFTSGQLTYSETFDGMGATGTSFITGWTAIRYAGTGTVGATLSPIVGAGAANSGGIYNVGSTGSGERAMGTLASGSTVPRMGASFSNNTGNAVTYISLAGVMEQWRSASNNTINEICPFEYSLDATDLTTGTWLPATNFDLLEKLITSTVNDSVVGNLPENQTSLSATISGISWANGTTMWIRWSDANDGGSDGLFAIDNFSMTVSTGSVATISVTSPTAGSQWIQGSSHAITWTSSGINADVKIEFSDNASAGTPTWTTLNASIAASAGTWTWNIPAGQALSTDCKIRITDIPQTAVGNSGTFSIIAPPVQVTTLAALRAGTPGTVYTYTGQGILTFKQTFRNQKYIQDATAAILIDDVSGKITTSYNVGDAITNITGTVADFGNMIQLTPQSDPGPAASTGNVITPEVVTLTQLNSNFENYESELIRISNLTFTGATGNFANGVVYPVADAGSVAANFRTTFYDVDYINTPVPSAPLDMVAIPNSRSDGDFLTSRNLADFYVLIPTITVTSPNGGQFYQQGTQQTITWMSTNFTGNVKIELTGTNAAVLAASTANTGSFIWNIPANQVIATDYKIKISDATDGDPMDESNTTFAIVAPYTIPDLVITEIMYNSPGDDEEWVELYNNSSASVNMEGFYILDDDPTHAADPIVLPAGAVLAPGGRYTVKNATFGAFPFVPNFDGSGKFSFGNTTDQVKLYHKFGQLIDSVKYADAAPWPTGPDGGGSTLTLCDPTLNNSLATSWAASTEPFQTLQGTTIYATPGSGCYVSSNDVLITEIMYNPIDAGNDTIEFIELYNKGSQAVNLKDWYFSSGVTYVFPDYTMAANSYYVVSRNSTAMQFTFGISCAQWTDGFLNDAGEAIVLKDALGQVKDSVYYLSVAPWPTTPNNGGPSLTFCNTALDNALGENWSASTNQVALNGAGQPIFASPGEMCSSGANLVLTEIMYNPPETGTDSLEFIEIYNAGNSINLQGFSFTSGIDFVFPSVNLNNGEYLLIAGNAAAIQSTFAKTALQWTSGSLNNSGETITLKDNFGATINEVTYSDVSPWDSLADGFGSSLTLCDPLSNNTLAINWKAATELAGVNAAGDSIFATPLGGCINPPTQANFVANQVNIIEGESVQFNDLSTNNPTSWSWTFEGGFPATSTEQNPLVTYDAYGLYSVTLTAQNEYGGTTITKTDYINVGVDGITTLPYAVAVYPNPTTGRVFITNPAMDVMEINIFNSVGQLSMSTVSGSEIISLDITGQPKGIYLVRISGKNNLNQQVVKIILK